MRSFTFVEPKSLEEAVDFLAEHGEESKVMAAGTDLLVQMKHRQVSPKYVVSLGRIPNLSSIEDGDGSVRIGALATHHAVERSPLVREKCGVLAQACWKMGTPQVRHVATIGGNICHASPSGESAPALLALDARVKIVGATGERIVPLEEFFVGPSRTLLTHDEILTEIEIPGPAILLRGVYLKLSPRKVLDTAVVGVAVVIDAKSKDGVCREVRIGLGAVGPTPFRARKAEAVLRGQRLSPEAIGQAAELAASEAQPIDDVRASADYRREMVQVLARRAIMETTGGE